MSSFVHPITNTTVFSQVDLRTHMRQLMELDFPLGLLPSFLHEITHHWCFMSPVGTTLALLRMRAYRIATFLRTNVHENHWNMLENILRQESTQELLRPLSESLSCFSEFDSIPGNSKIISLPMKLSFFYFGGIDNSYRQKGVEPFIYSLLYPVRTSNVASTRKENILASEFSLSSGGYLPGYLMIKGIWKNFIERYELARDSEFFLHYLKSYIFDDYGFVATILDPSLSSHNAVNNIASYFISRIKQLLVSDLDTDLKKFETYVAKSKYLKDVNRDYNHHEIVDGIKTDPNLLEIGKALLDDLIDEILNAPLPHFTSDPSGFVNSLLLRMDQNRINRRNVICIGSIDAMVTVNEYNSVNVYVKEDLFYSGNSLKGISPGKGPGSIEFYILTDKPQFVLSVMRNHECVDIYIPSYTNNDDLKYWKRMVGTQSIDLKMINEQEKNLEHVIEKNEIHIVRDNLTKNMPEQIMELYGRLATLHVDDKKWKKVSQTLQKGGLYHLFDRDANFLHARSIIGTASSVTTRKVELQEIAKERDISFEKFLIKAREIEEKTGYPIVYELAESLFCLV